jgi:tetratricopeptide (TPR) repeat protein
MRRLLQRLRVAVDPEHLAGLVHACRYAGLLDASLAAHEEARRLDPTIQTSVVNTWFAHGEFERIVTDTDNSVDPDGRTLAYFRLGRLEEARASWQRPPADAPPFLKAWDEMIMACLDGAPEARAITERVLGGAPWSDPEGYMTAGLVLARVGSVDLALARLRDAVDGGFHVPHMLANDAWLAPLRHDPRFSEILRDARARTDAALAVFRAEGGERLLGLRSAA